MNDTFNIMSDLKREASIELQRLMESGEVVGLLGVDPDTLGATEREVPSMAPLEASTVTHLRELGRVLGSDEGKYSTGMLDVTFESKAAALKYMDELDLNEYVYAYNCEVEGSTDEDGEVDIADIPDNATGYRYHISVVLDPSIVQFAVEDVEVQDGDIIDDDNGAIMEVKRAVKVNFRGKKRIKMVCNPGYRYNPDRKVCEKITGAEMAKSRIAHRHAVMAKKAQGSAFKARLVRKTRKALRFRKAMGI